MTNVEQLRFTETHEWIRLDGEMIVVGITDHAQREITDVVFVELPKVGKVVQAKISCMIVESVKAAFDIYAPLAGEIARVNERLSREPELVNQSPYGDGWLFALRPKDPSALNRLMTHAQYQAFLTSGSPH